MSYAIFDLDDVLANLRDPIQAALTKSFGKDIHHRDWDRYDLADIYNVPLGEIIDAFLEHEILDHAVPEAGAQEAMAAARAAGHRVAVLTARGWHPNGTVLTRQWLGDHGLLPDELHVVELHRRKEDELHRYGRVAWMIDDNLAHVHGAAATGLVDTVVLMTRPWNRAGHHDARVNDLFEYAELIAAKKSKVSA